MGLMDRLRKSGDGEPEGRQYNLRTQINDRLPAYMTGEPTPDQDGPVSLKKAAKVSVEKRPTLRNRQFAVYLMADMSGSMASFIQNGDLDFLTEAILTLVDENDWDADRIIPCVPYATGAAGAVDIHLGQHKGAAHRMQTYGQKNRIGFGTMYHHGIEAVVQHYQSSPDWGKRPAIVILQSDGADNDPNATAQLLTRYSSLPVFWVMVYFGEVNPDGRDGAKSMRALDSGGSMPGRVTDNVSLFIAGPEPQRVTPTELYEGLLDGPAKWLAQAPRDGVQLPG